MSNASPDHNGATPKPIPFDNKGVGKAFSATSVHTTSTICAIVNLDLSVKRARLHCLIGNSLGACAVNHAIRRNLRAWVRSRPTYGRRARRPISHNRLPTVFGEICRLCVPTVCIKGSFGSSEVTIQQMCQTDCPVLTSRHHAWTPRPRSVC